MCYSVWSRGRLVGCTDLEFTYRRPDFRAGWFHPTDAGEKLMPMATVVAPAFRASREAGTDFRKDPDVVSAYDYERALELELYADDGDVIKTDDIAIIDTRYLLSIAERETEEGNYLESVGTDDEKTLELDACDRQAEWEAPWRGSDELPRYQIQAYVAGHEAI